MSFFWAEASIWIFGKQKNLLALHLVCLICNYSQLHLPLNWLTQNNFSPENLMWLVPASQTEQLSLQSTAKAEVEQSSGLPGFPVLAFLVRKVFVPTFVPEMAAGGSPEVTLVSVDWTTSPRTEKHEIWCMLRVYIQPPQSIHSRLFLAVSLLCIFCKFCTSKHLFCNYL